MRGQSHDLWLSEPSVCYGLATAADLVGGMLYATLVWPRTGPYVIAPVGVMLAVSLVSAERMRDRSRDWSLL